MAIVLRLESAQQYRVLMMILQSHRTLSLFTWCFPNALSNVLLRYPRSCFPCFFSNPYISLFHIHKFFYLLVRWTSNVGSELINSSDCIIYSLMVSISLLVTVHACIKNLYVQTQKHILHTSLFSKSRDNLCFCLVSSNVVIHVCFSSGLSA